MQLRSNAAVRHFEAASAATHRIEGVDDQEKTAVALNPSAELLLLELRQNPTTERGAMSKTTRATQALASVGVKFALHVYDYDPDADRIGLQAAEALGVEPRRLLKTLMAEVDGKPVCVVVPSDREVSMKKLAAAFGGKAANMMRPADAERLTGYHVGGISPFGQKKRVPVAVDQAALNETSVYLNGGQRGLQIEIEPNDAVRALGAIVQPLTA
jgi:Cys-tRNA(Pro)/Cys-tRNA(Cys) deacylase